MIAAPDEDHSSDDVRVGRGHAEERGVGAVEIAYAHGVPRRVQLRSNVLGIDSLDRRREFVEVIDAPSDT